MRAKWFLIPALFIACLSVGARGDDWPQFRGPNGSSTSTEKRLPTKWSADRNVVWKATLPGYGWSSPIVWGDKVFLTTAVTEKQKKPAAGFGAPGEFGGGGRPGGPGGFPPRPSPGQVLLPFVQQMLMLTDEQKKQVKELQKEVDGKLETLLTDEQKKQMKEPPQGPGRGGFGGFGGFPQPGQILAPALQERLKLTAEQKKQHEELQKQVDARLAKILSDEQNKQVKEMRNFGAAVPVVPAGQAGSAEDSDRRMPSTASRFTVSIAPPAKCCGDRPPAKASRASPHNPATPTPPRRPSPTANGSMPISECTASIATILMAFCSGKRISAPIRWRWVSAPAARRLWTTADCLSSATTSRNHSSWRWMRRQARNCGV